MMIKFIIRTLTIIIVLFAVFLAGVFAGSQGWLGWLTGNFKTTTSVVTILDRIQAMSQLTTTRYSYSNILTSERELPPILAGLYGESLVMVAVGEVNAGIDLSKITTDNLQTVDNTLIVHLPPAQLHDCFFNEQQSYVVSRDTGFFARPLPSLDETARLYALGQFRDKALEDGILADAQSQAATAVQEMVSGLAGTQYAAVRVVSDPLPAQSTIPETCQ
ncbi:MAG TPA: DUF4230 domain-containing protein [Phototrophicaceae bacterium]|jgi:hypothetical protein|nr:DUF4230 domain-containing protein [Phototrophicaceae bacterium]